MIVATPMTRLMTISAMSTWATRRATVVGYSCGGRMATALPWS